METIKLKDIIVVIPAYNEVRTIGGIVTKLKKRGLYVIVIDDGSSDNTGIEAENHGALVLNHLKNLGKGESIKRVLRLIMKQHDSFKWVLFMDGDGQHAPEDVTIFLRRLVLNSSEILHVILGRRVLTKHYMPKLRSYANKFMSWVISKICKQYIPDTQCGYRLISKEALRSINLTSSNYEIDTEMLIKLSRKGYKMISVPIKTIYGQEVSYISPIKDGWRFIKFFVKILRRKDE